MRDHKHKAQSKRSSLKLLVFFCLAVLLAVSLSLGYKLFTLMQSSVFDGQHAIMVSFIYHNDVDVIGINPQQKSFSHLQIRGGSSSEDAMSEASILPDATITLQEPFSIDNLSNYFFKANGHQGGEQTALNIYDLYRLGALTKSISPQDITTQSVHVPLDTSASTTLLQQLFLDDAIDSENKTVSIRNGAGLVGLGTRLEQPLTTIGVSVISVTNSDKVSSTSKIQYYGKKSYTLKRLATLLHMPTEQITTQGISDIIIIVGKDRSQTTEF